MAYCSKREDEEERFDKKVKEEEERGRKLRVLCLHGFRTSASIFQQQLLQRFDPSILHLLDLTFINAPFSSKGISDVGKFYPPPYYEWYRFNWEHTQFVGVEESIKYVTNFMDSHGPFDGLMGFSQGAILSIGLAGLQQKGLGFQNQPLLRFVVLISGALFKNEELAKDCYSELIKCPSIHLIGSGDWLKTRSEDVLKVFENPIVIHHQGKHNVPKLDAKETKVVTDFLLHILEDLENCSTDNNHCSNTNGTKYSNGEQLTTTYTC